MKTSKTSMFLVGLVFSLSALLCSPVLVKAADGGEIHSGETKSGNIATNGQMDSYVFQGSAGQGAVIEMAADDSDLGPAMYLYSPDGALETSLVGGDFANRVRLDSYQLKKTGTYTIVTAASWAGWTTTTGKYGLSLVLVPGPTLSGQDPDGGDIASGQTHSSSISPSGDTDAFTFQGKAGQGAVIEMAADDSDLGPAMYLYSPDGALETSLVGGDFANRVRLDSYQLKKTGAYTLVTAASWAGWTTTTGKYGLSLVLLGGTGTLTPGTPTAPITPSPEPTAALPPTPVSPSEPPPSPVENSFTGSVPLPSQVSTDPKVIGTNALLTSLLIVIFYFAATLFNGTFKENYETIQNWARRLRTLSRLQSQRVACSRQAQARACSTSKWFLSYL